MGATSLADLIAATAGGRLAAGDSRLSIAHLTHDSRECGPGSLFVALPGRNHDGAAFVPDALRRGAVAVASESPPADGAVAWIVVPSARRALADLAAALYGYPSEALRLIGVTGTDGKTTTTRLIASLLEAAGHPCGWSTTTDRRIGGALLPNTEERTTPEADRVQAVLAAAREAGDRCVVFEASSHALAQDRLRGCTFDVGVFTNLSPEHLDFHGSMDEYLAAKARLFAMLGEPTRKAGPRYAVLNADDPASAVLRKRCPVPTVSYGLDAGADVRASAIEQSRGGLHLSVQTAAGAWKLQTQFVGRHNASNWLAAIAVALQEGVSPATIQEVSAGLAPPPGRLERVDVGQPFGVYVDFAHTPQALRAALAAMRGVCAGRVLLAFGHAGGRTAANRPLLGAIAAASADYFVITSDDAYPEDPAAIAAAIEAGAREAGATPHDRYAVCLDRREAIRRLIGRAASGDVVLLAGMGHENTLRVRAVADPWSDVEEARQALLAAGYAGGAELQAPPAAD
jgi:UDP-N-acetylmuramoyl-L-alanyl-D-glutamate--2,6-diaminopimelate ligase